MATPEKKRADFLIDLIIHTANLLRQELKLSEGDAEALGYKLTDSIRQIHGGSNIYIPKGMQMDVAIRQNGIIQDFRGSNHAELAKKYDCSEAYVYQVIRAYTLATRRTIQPGLFPDEPEQQ